MRSLSRRDSTSIWPVCVSITGRRTGKRSGFSGSFLRGSTSGSCSGDMYSPLESHFMPGYLQQQQQAPHQQRSSQPRAQVGLQNRGLCRSACALSRFTISPEFSKRQLYLENQDRKHVNSEVTPLSRTYQMFPALITTADLRALTAAWRATGAMNACTTRTQIAL